MNLDFIPILLVYIAGIYLAYFYILGKCEVKPRKNEEYSMLFLVSLLSWLVFPLYCIAWIIKKTEEGQQ